MAEQALLDPTGLSITRMCELLALPRSSYYAWQDRQHRPPTLREQRHQALTEKIVARFRSCQGRVGRRPMHTLLARDGITCAPGTVHRIMAEQGLQANRHRAARRTTRQDPAARTSQIENHCLDADGNRDFHSDVPGTKTCGDITYLQTREGWCYLAVVLDLATRAVIGWALRSSLHTEVVSAALSMARTHGYLRDEAIFHSDRGSQYTATSYQDLCGELKVTQSMGQVGICWDNAVAEAFFATLKTDLVAEIGVFRDREHATGWVATYIEGWYNRRRPHTVTGGEPPMLAFQRLWGLAPLTVQTS
ncbi:MAG: IS3 family transposase [Verrucomicrobiae bacterium]|nr:IS3 family transposase [Verrucomicrobiae bacterium]